MKTTLYLSLISLVSFCSVVNAQYEYNPERLPLNPYKPLHYIGLDTAWYKTSYSSWDVSDTMDGYKCFASPVSPNYYPMDDGILLTDDAVFQFYYRRTFRDITGTYVEKRDIRTGNLLWQTYFGYPKQEKLEAARFMRINSDGNLEVISQVKNDPYYVNEMISGNRTTILSRRIFDPQDGRLLVHEVNPDYDNALKFRFNQGLGQSVWFYPEGDSIRLFKIHFKDTTKIEHRYTSAIFDPYLSTNAIFDSLPVRYVAITPLKPFRINENRYLILEREEASERIFLRYVDRHLKILEEYLSESVGFPIYNVNMLDFDPVSGDVLLLKHHYVVPPNFFPTYEVIRLDSKGNIKQRLAIKYDFYYWFDALDWKGKEKITLIAGKQNYTDRDRFFYGFDILESNANATFDLVRFFPSNDSLRGGLIWAIQEVNEDEWIMQWEEVARFEKVKYSGRYASDDAARAMATVRVRKSSMLGSNTKTLDESRNPAISVYPNPLTGEEIMISASDGFRGRMTFYDPLGRSVYSSAIDEQERRSYDVGHLKAGLYFILFEPDDRTFKRTTVRFVKF
jgi:hypothetical protein